MAQIERDGIFGNKPLAAFAIFLLASVAYAQSFEVASIKPHPGEVTISADPAVRGSRVIGTASTLLDMITNAYGVRYDQVSGAPNWAGSDHYDVDAKAPGDTPPTAGQARLMMQALLAERFQLKLHRETRQVPVYALVVDKDGPKLKAGAVGVATGGSMRATTIGLRMETKNSGGLAGQSTCGQCGTARGRSDGADGQLRIRARLVSRKPRSSRGLQRALNVRRGSGAAGVEVGVIHRAAGVPGD